MLFVESNTTITKKEFLYHHLTILLFVCEWNLETKMSKLFFNVNYLDCWIIISKYALRVRDFFFLWRECPAGHMKSLPPPRTRYVRHLPRQVAPGREYEFETTTSHSWAMILTNCVTPRGLGHSSYYVIGPNLLEVKIR